MNKRIFVIDGHALCYRAYFAFINNPLTNSSGQNVSAIYGFARMLLKLMEDQHPDYLVVAFDPPKKTFRFDIYPEYKAQREKMPDDLRSQIEEIKHMLSVLRIPQVIVDNYEADDVMGSMAQKYAGSGYEVILVTGDKDAYQLVNDRVKIYAGKKGISDFQMYDEEAVTEKLGITPGQVIDYMALVGDSSDNIPGVRGVGAKTAQKLIQEYDSIDAIYENLDNIKGKMRDNLADNRDMAYLSKDLVSIRTGIDVPLDIEKAETPDIKTAEAREYFNNLEMNTIADTLQSGEENTETADKKKDREYILVRNSKQLEDVVTEIQKASIISVDTETTSKRPVEADLLGISISIEPGKGWYIPVPTGTLFEDDLLAKHEIIEKLKPVLENPGIGKIGQNIKYDIIVLAGEGITMAGIHFDTMIASYLLNPAERRHNLDDLAMDYLGYTTTTYKQLLAGAGKKAASLADVSLEDIADYAIEDADITLRLYHILENKLKEENLESLFYEVEMPLVMVLARVEMHGVKIDHTHFTIIRQENEEMLEEVKDNIFKLSEEIFNINSTRELARILFEKLALKPVKKTKTGFSTDIQVLEALRKEHDIIEHLITYRTLSKLKSTYIDTLPKLVNQSTGRIHTSFNQAATATGRLSSSDPNLQNIPIRDILGKKIRQGFVPAKGCVMLSADYSQIELRLAAHLSGDETMLSAFREGIDIHSKTAASVYNTPIDSVQPEMRRQAKIINFATIYGVSPYGLSQQADISMEEAREFIKIYFETYPGFKKYIDDTIAFARETGFVQTLLGRKRPVPDINAEIQFRREGAERIAINTPIQGTSADMIKIAMIRIHEQIKKQKLASALIMQVHDELVFEVPVEEKDIMESMVKDAMEHALKLDVPIVVDMGWGKNWAESH